MNNHQIKPNREIKVLPILIIFIVLALLGSALLAVITPKQQEIVQTDFVTNNYDNTQSTFKKVNFSGSRITPPEKMKIYRTGANVNLSNELAQKIINGYQLEQATTAENYWFRDNYILNRNISESRYSFNLEATSNQNQVNIIVTEAVKSCLNFYLKYNLSLSLVPQEENLIYLRGNLEQYETTEELASSVYIPLTYELDGYPVFYQNESNYPFFCKVNNNYEIEKIVFKDFYYTFEAISEMNSINLDQAVKNIQNGKASIIEAKSNIAYALDLNWINEADLYEVKIEYRYDEKLKIAYPFYNFSAKITNAGGINIEATIITPAVDTAKEK